MEVFVLAKPVSVPALLQGALGLRRSLLTMFQGHERTLNAVLWAHLFVHFITCIICTFYCILLYILYIIVYLYILLHFIALFVHFITVPYFTVQYDMYRVIYV